MAAGKGCFIKHCWKFLKGEEADLARRSDSSAARAQAGRIGVGRTRHIAAGLLWLQQKVKQFELLERRQPSTPVTRTKILSKARAKAVEYLVKMVDGDDQKIGKEQLEELQVYEGRAEKEDREVAKAVGGSVKIDFALALSMLQGGKAAKIEETQLQTVRIRDEFSHFVLSAVSLAWWIIMTVNKWRNGRRVRAGASDENEEEVEAQRTKVEAEANGEKTEPEEPQYEEDQEKVRMHWHIVQLEAAYADQAEKLPELKEDPKDQWHRR